MLLKTWKTPKLFWDFNPFEALLNINIGAWNLREIIFLWDRTFLRGGSQKFQTFENKDYPKVYVYKLIRLIIARSCSERRKLALELHEMKSSNLYSACMWNFDSISVFFSWTKNELKTV